MLEAWSTLLPPVCSPSHRCHHLSLFRTLIPSMLSLHHGQVASLSRHIVSLILLLQPIQVVMSIFCPLVIPDLSLSVGSAITSVFTFGGRITQ